MLEYAMNLSDMLQFYHIICLYRIKGRQYNKESEKAFVRTKEDVWHQNKDYGEGAIFYTLADYINLENAKRAFKIQKSVKINL